MQLTAGVGGLGRILDPLSAARQLALAPLEGVFQRALTCVGMQRTWVHAPPRTVNANVISVR